jgi:hypothetical protein
MDWFERLTGFRETDYADTRARLADEATRLKSVVNGKSYGIGELELASLQARWPQIRPPSSCATAMLPFRAWRGRTAWK